MSSIKDLIVWQKAVDLCVLIYKETQSFPKEEVYGLTLQIRRCAVSIPSNIAEGQKRAHKNEFKQFLHISYGSASELETQLLIANKIGYLPQESCKKVLSDLDEVQRMLNSLIAKLPPSKD